MREAEISEELQIAREERRRQHQYARPLRRTDRAEGTLKIAGAPDLLHTHLKAERPRDFLERLQRDGAGRRVPQYAEFGELGHGLPEHLQTLRTKLRQIEKDASYIPARMPQARGPAVGDRVGLKINRNDRNGLGGAICSVHR